MGKLYFKLFTVLFFALIISSCKLDAPVYPEGTVYVPPTGTGGTGGTNTGGVVSGRTITYTIDGKTTTLKSNVIFQVYTADQTPPSGSLQIGGGTDVSNLFSLLCSPTGTGTFDVTVMVVGTTLIGDGSVTFTEYSATSGSKGTVAGTFTGELADISGGSNKTVTGSFSIKM